MDDKKPLKILRVKDREGVKYKPLHPHLPQPCACVLHCSPVKTGKSTIISNILLSDQFYAPLDPFLFSLVLEKRVDLWLEAPQQVVDLVQCIVLGGLSGHGKAGGFARGVLDREVGLQQERSLDDAKKGDQKRKDHECKLDEPLSPGPYCPEHSTLL